MTDTTGTPTNPNFDEEATFDDGGDEVPHAVETPIEGHDGPAEGNISEPAAG